MLPDYSQVWKLISTALRFAEVSAAPTTAQIPTLSLALYAKAKAGNSNLYFKNDAGTEFDLGLATAPAALTKNDDTNVTLTLGGTPATALLQAVSLTLGWTGTLGVARGGTNLASYAVGDLIYASGATTLAKLADVAAGSYLRSGGVTTAPLWSTLILPNAATANRVVYATASNTYGESADVTYDGTDFGIGSGKRFRMQSQNRTRYLNSIARVRRTTNQTIADTTTTAVNFTSENFDTDALHDTVTNNTRITCNLTGKYLVTGNISFDTNGTGFRLAFIQHSNSAGAAQSYAGSNTVVPSASFAVKVVVCGLLSMVATDYAEVYVQQNSGGNLDITAANDSESHFDMVYLGE